MKILLVHNSYLEPGGEDVVFEQENRLLRWAGHEVIEYCRRNDEIAAYSAMERLDLLRRTVWATDSRSEFSRLLHSSHPDVVHVHNTFPLISPSIYSVCQEARVPVVQTLHNYRLLCPQANFFRNGKPCEECMQQGLWRGIQHACYRNSRLATAGTVLMLAVHRQKRTWDKMVDLYITLSDFARRKFIAAGFQADKIEVKPNFLRSDPGGRTAPGSYVVFVGRSSPEKGLPTLIKAWRWLDKGIPLRIVGDSPYQAEMQEQAAQLQSADIRFLGRQPHEQTITAIKQSRFLVFPSELYETFGLSIIEAFACGVPVIASNLGAMSELVEDGRTGLLFRPGDSTDLAEKIAWAWNHPEIMEKLGRNARLTYEQKYTAEKNYSELMKIYAKAAARRCATATTADYQVAENGISA